MKVLSPTSGFPACGSSKGTRNPQGIRRCRPVWALAAGLPLGETEGTHRTQGEGAGAPQETEPSLPIVLKGLLQRCGWQWFTLRTRGLAGAVLRSTSWCEFSWRPPRRDHRVWRLRAGSLGQTTNREGSQPRPAADKQIKVILSRALTARTRTSSLHCQSLPSGSLHNPFR